MSLTARFSTFFLSALALVLVAFSTALLVSASFYLEHELENRMAAALAVLAAAAEIHPEGVEWEPTERFLPLGQEPGLERVRWMVFEPNGRLIDQSRNLAAADLTDRWLPATGTTALPGRLDDRQRRSWRISQRRISPEGQTKEPHHPSKTIDGEGKPEDPSDRYHPSLTLTVFALRGPMEATLASLAWFLVGLSVIIWLLSALLCRRISRRALAPLTRMVESARGLDAADAGWSLPRAGTGDELDNLGQAFNDLLSRLHIAFERQRRFSGDASHQLRTPLTVLIGQVEVALRQERSAEEYRRVLRSALGRATQLGQIVEALLFLARAEGEAHPPQAEVIDLASWTAARINDRRATHPALNLIHQSLESEAIPVQVHPPLLGQLLENLIDNACKHGQTGMPVQVETFVEGPVAVLVVADHGPGIPPLDLPHVFEPFYRSRQAHRQGVAGVGLGLAVVQRIALAFGGTVVVRSESGQGCRVEVRLPIVARADAMRFTFASQLSITPSIVDIPAP